MPTRSHYPNAVSTHAEGSRRIHDLRQRDTTAESHDEVDHSIQRWSTTRTCPATRRHPAGTVATSTPNGSSPPELAWPLNVERMPGSLRRAGGTSHYGRGTTPGYK
jgi:hypothetical protein